MTVAAATPMAPVTCVAPLLEPDALAEPAVDFFESALAEESVAAVESPAFTAPVKLEEL
ncbi:hypothetical protein PF003_g36736 [Phytophthora fragariae]|nr:hypothetical protein PF003_g36736 [Phytophthora fragariae]